MEDTRCWSAEFCEAIDRADNGEVKGGTQCSPQQICIQSNLLSYHCTPFYNPDKSHGMGISNNFKNCHCIFMSVLLLHVEFKDYRGSLNGDPDPCVPSV